MKREEIIIFVVGQAIMLPVAFLLRSVVIKFAEKAIIDKKLATGIYRFFPFKENRWSDWPKVIFLEAILPFGSSY